MNWLLLLIPPAFVLWLLSLRAMSPPAPRGPLAQPGARVVIIKPAFSNAEIAIIHTKEVHSTDEE